MQELINLQTNLQINIFCIKFLFFHKFFSYQIIKLISIYTITKYITNTKNHYLYTYV